MCEMADEIFSIFVNVVDHGELNGICQVSYRTLGSLHPPTHETLFSVTVSCFDFDFDFDLSSFLLSFSPPLYSMIHSMIKGLLTYDDMLLLCLF